LIILDGQKFSNKSELVISTDVIGKTIQSDKYQITMDEFWFSIFDDNIVEPFDFISVENIHDTVTIGIVKELRTIRNTDVTISKQISNQVNNNLRDSTSNTENYVDQGIRIARVVVMANAQIDNIQSNSKTKYKGNIRMPVNIDKVVRFATEKEIFIALGIPKMEDPVMAGVIEMSNGQKIAIPIAMSYLAGPDTAHINATGISGNLKTSYVMFLLHSMYQKLIKNKEVAIIIFNTREDDLLYIHQREEGKITEKDNKLYEILKISADPFDNVTYFLPRGKDGKPISVHIPPNFRTYSYELKDIYDRLDLLLSSESYDPRYNLYTIINYIYESWPLQDSSNNIVKNWSDLLKYTNYPPEIVGHKSMYLHFLGYIQKFKRSSLFTDKRKTSIYIGNEISKIKAGDVFVIDIAMIPTLEEQSLVIGDVMKNIDELYSSRYSFENSLEHELENGIERNTEPNKQKKPKYILIFIDEINRFLPHIYSLGNRSAVAEQIIKTIIAGKSRNTILLSAQQFKSAVDPILHENTGVHMIAKLGLSELSTSSYSMLDDITKGNIAQMDKGEIVMIQPAIRHPVKVVFPRPPFKRISR
jgi:DNA helicase HerA-like ATPase